MLSSMVATADIVFLLDKNAAFRQGHIAVLIGSEFKGWHYISINGTQTGSKPWGVNFNADTGAVLMDSNGKKISNLRLAIHSACVVNPLRNHNYGLFRRLQTSSSEDLKILSEVKKIAESWIYGVFGPGNSCIDVAQKAFSTLVKLRCLDKNGSVPGKTDLIPKNWFRKIDNRIKSANKRSKNNKIRFYRPLNKKNKIVFHGKNWFDMTKIIKPSKAKKDKMPLVVRVK